MTSRYDAEVLRRETPHQDKILLGYYESSPGRGVYTRQFKLTDRWDLIADTTQKDSTMWWVIADLNPHTEFDPFNRSGGAVYIPAVTEGL